jgi:hypothetical protein
MILASLTFNEPQKRQDTKARDTMSDRRYKLVNIMDSFKMDRTAFLVKSLLDESDDRAYWLSKTPDERIEAIELMRQINYGYNPITARLQRILEFAELTSS